MRRDPATLDELLPADYPSTVSMIAQRLVNEQQWEMVYMLNGALLDEASDAFDRMNTGPEGMRRFHRSRRRDALDLAHRIDWAVRAADRATGNA